MQVCHENKFIHAVGTAKEIIKGQDTGLRTNDSSGLAPHVITSPV